MRMSLSWRVNISTSCDSLSPINTFLLNLVYSKKVQATTHNPDKVLDLKKCVYIGLKIPTTGALGHQETFEFVVSIENCDVVTFSAKTW